MIKVLSEKGYCIDVIGSTDLNSLDYIQSNNYELILGFGETFYRMVQLQPYAISILYMTENHPEISFREEQKRLDYFESRHGKRVRMQRSGKFYPSKHLHIKYSHVITMGDVSPFLDAYKKPYQIFPTGLFNRKFDGVIVNDHSTIRNFLWLGSYGAIHKGLDLLIDVFSKRQDIMLHIGGLRDEDRKLLRIPARMNIIDHGHIDIASDSFLNLIRKCSFVILPSCSEACATSITTGMLHGLLPIVMRKSGFDHLGETVFYLDDYHISYVDQAITNLTRLPLDELNHRAREAFLFAHNNFTVSNFEVSFRNILLDILHEQN